MVNYSNVNVKYAVAASDNNTLGFTSALSQVADRYRGDERVPYCRIGGLDLLRGEDVT